MRQQAGRYQTLPHLILSLALTVPQAAVLRTEEGYVAPQFWDEGIPALMLSWNTTWYNTRTKGSAKETNDDPESSPA